MDELNTGSKTATIAQPAKQPPPSPQVGGPTGDEKHESANSKAKGEHWIHKAPPWIEAACAIALVVITGFYTYYAGGQVEQLKESVRQTGDAIIVAKGQLAVAAQNTKAAAAANDLAQKSINEAIATNQLDQRAWIGVARIDGEPELNKVWNVVVDLHNSGKTVARNIKSRIASDRSPHFDFSSIKLDSIGVLEPSGDVRVSISPVASVNDPTHPPARVPQSVLDRISSGSAVVYITGCLTYDDVFGRHHWREYCFSHNADGGYAPCPNHNAVDDDRYTQGKKPSCY